MSIKNVRAERLVREVAKKTGESLTDAIVHSLEERLERLKDKELSEAKGRETDTRSAIEQLCHYCQTLPDLDSRSSNEILGYDSQGLP
jgi:antitoxin VapB